MQAVRIGTVVRCARDGFGPPGDWRVSGVNLASDDVYLERVGRPVELYTVTHKTAEYWIEVPDAAE